MQCIAGSCGKNACPRKDGLFVSLALDSDSLTVNFNPINTPFQQHLNGGVFSHRIKPMIKLRPVDDDCLSGGRTVVKLLTGRGIKADGVKFVQDGVGRYAEFTKSVGRNDPCAMNRLYSDRMFFD